MDLKELKTVQEIHEAYASRKASPVEVVKAYLAAARASDLNAFLALCEERALAQAREAEHILARETKEKGRPHGAFRRWPLLGIPMGVKDALTIDGVRTTAGSKVLENYIPPYTATCVQRLEKAGAVTLGKLNMDEFAMGSSNENSAFGPVKHPTHPGHVPGGSSGGSAVAVRAGLCSFALGSDTGGSIRLPASFCGVVGVKPTYGRVSRYGLIAFASSLDQVGPLAHTIDDCARVLEVMAGHDPKDSTSAPAELSAKAGAADKLSVSAKLGGEIQWAGIRIGVPSEYFVEGISPDVKKSVRSALDWYRARGAELVPISLPHTRFAVATYYVIAVSEASSNLARLDGVRYGARPAGASESGDLEAYYESVRALFGAEVKRRILLGTFALSSGYYDAYYRRACQVRRLIRQDFEDAFKKVDVIASPVSPTTAFRSGEKLKDPLQMYLADIFTLSASLAGVPALSLPCGQDSVGLPIGLQLIAPHFHEERLMRLAHAFERRASEGGET